MSIINPKTKEVQIKIVYYGPGRGGKTTNLVYINDHLKKYISSNLVSIKTHGDRTLFFDFLPLDITMANGYQIKVQLYTVPGQVKYNATRKLVLRGVDGIVFVADSMALRKAANIESLRNLRENLAGFNRKLEDMPLVFQYNKRDLEGEDVLLLSRGTLDADLNAQLQRPCFEASALYGNNVSPTLKKIIHLTVQSVQKKLNI